MLDGPYSGIRQIQGKDPNLATSPDLPEWILLFHCLASPDSPIWEMLCVSLLNEAMRIERSRVPE